MKKIENVSQRLRDYFENTPREEVLALWDQCNRPEYEGTVTVREAMEALEGIDVGQIPVAYREAYIRSIRKIQVNSETGRLLYEHDLPAEPGRPDRTHSPSGNGNTEGGVNRPTPPQSP